MKCKSCPDDKIKNGSNCYTIKDNRAKTFYDPDDSTNTLSCQTFGKYIIENTNECIDKPEENYFVSNIFTGILSPCNNKCKTCISKCSNLEYGYSKAIFLTCVLKTHF